MGKNSIYEKLLNKWNVETVTVLGKTFNIGDTLTLNIGAGLNGEFISTKMNEGMGGQTHLGALYIEYNFIIWKIRERKDGLNSYIIISFLMDLGKKKVIVSLDPRIAIARKELL